MSKYEEIKTYLLSTQMNVSKPGLDRIKSVLSSFGNPEKDLNVIHVVGTNGKGSVSKMLSQILVASGISAGLFSSPYISELTEYISLNNEAISKEEFAEISELIRDKLKETGLELTHFEFVTVLSVLYFSNKQCVCIYEAGMGGREDASNIFDNALCTVLTSIGLDHTAYLGNTIEEIVAAKAGIVNRGETLIYSTSNSDPARDVVIRFCKNNEINFIEANSDNVIIKEQSVDRITFDYDHIDNSGEFERIENIRLKSGALYQVKNAVAVITAIKHLNYQNALKTVIQTYAMKKGLSKFYLKSRFDVIKNEPLIIVDGGHNPDCVNELVKSLGKNKKYTIVTGVMADKDYEKMYDILHEHAKCFICVDNGLKRALPSAILSRFLEKYNLPVYNAKTTLIAASLVRRMCTPYDNVIFLGTLYITDSFKEAVELVYNDEKVNAFSSETISRLTSKSFYSKHYSLNDMKQLLKEFDSPQNELSVIHVAGTNGKGSTCSMIYSILSEYGLKTGLFTSPYIRIFNERISFDGEFIENEMLFSIAEAVLDVQKKLEIDLNQFALIAAIAFIYYKLVDADVVVLETGLGGTYDPTNVVEKPLCSVITNIGFDHMSVLGNTIEEISNAKAGIIKEGVPVVCYPLENAALKVINDVAYNNNSLLYKVLPNDIEIISSGKDGTRFRYKGKTYQVSLPGDFQANNAAVAITTVLTVCDKIHLDFICSGLRNVKWKGRLELISEKPLCYLDGGHNVQCIKNVVSFFNRHYTDMKKVYIAGFMKDKDFSGMIHILAEDADVLYLVPVKNERSLSYRELTIEANKYNINVRAIESLDKAYEEAIDNADMQTVMCIIGSLYQLNDFYLLDKE